MFYKLLEISTKFMNGEEWTVEDFSNEMIDFKDDFVLIVVDELRDSMEFSYLNNLFSNYDFYFGFNESFQVGPYSFLWKCCLYET